MLAPIIALLALAFAAPADGPVAFRTIAQGTDSKVNARTELVARTAGSWQLIWFKHHGTYDAPPIDPSREMILAVFAGSRLTGVSGVHVISVSREDRALVVRYRLQSGEPTLRDAGARTTPFHIIAVPADRGAVRFVEVRDLAPDRVAAKDGVDDDSPTLRPAETVTGDDTRSWLPGTARSVLSGRHNQATTG
jgi:hypothetical protein